MTTSTETIFSYLVYSICGLALIIDLCLIPFIIHIWAYRKHAFIKPRSPKLSYSILWIFFSVTILAIINGLLYFSITDIWRIEYFILLNDSIQYACTFAYATRAWILFYYVEWSYESINDIWRTQMSSNQNDVTPTPSTNLDPVSSVSLSEKEKDVKSSKSSKPSNFYARHKERYGNPLKVFPIVMFGILPLFIILLDILPLFIFKSINNSNSDDHLEYIILRIVQIILFIIIFLITYYWVYKIHQIADKYWIAQELSRITFSLASCIIIGRILSDFIFYLIFSNKYLFIFTNTICTILSILLSLYFSSFWILRKLFSEFAGSETLKKIKSTSSKLKYIVTIGVKDLYERQQSNKHDILQHKFLLTLNQVLGTKLGFEVFTQFLISELAVENILFLVEVKQYKARCRQYHKEEKKAPNAPNAPKQLSISSNTKALKVLPDGRTIELNTTLSSPRPDISSVVSLRPTTTTHSKPDVFKSRVIINVDYLPSNSELQNLDPYDYAMYLYHKYVRMGSDLQINIPSKTYKMLTKFLIKTDKMITVTSDNYTDDMFKLYDKAWEEIHRLIDKDSFSRFRDTKEYDEICKNTKIEKEKSKQHSNQNSLNSVHSIENNPGLLNWNSKEMVMIEEDEEVDDMLETLNSIKHYDNKTKNDKNDKIDNNNDDLDNDDDDDDDLDEDILMETLNELKNYQIAKKDDDDDESDEDLDAELDKLNSIQDYNSNTKAKQNVP